MNTKTLARRLASAAAIALASSAAHAQFVSGETLTAAALNAALAAPTITNGTITGLTAPLSATLGGLGIASPTNNAVLIGSGSSAVRGVGPCTTGQTLVGVTSSAPVCGNNPLISGTTIDNTVIGGTTPAAVNSTTLSASGSVSGAGFTSLLSPYLTSSTAASTYATLGANSNITSLSGLTTPLSVVQGGSGSTSLAQYSVLIGNGTGAFSTASPGTSGYVLTSNGASSLPTFQAFAGLSGRLLNIQVFTASGTYTPTSGATKALVRCVGNGGGGGGVPATSSGQAAVGGSGSAGGYGEIWISSGLTTQTVTFGAVGSGGAAGANAGGTGGSVSFGSLLTCGGGAGGAAGSATSSFPTGAFPSTSGGVVSGSGTFLVKRNGGYGLTSFALSSTLAISGNGADSPLGAGASQAIGAGAAAPSNGYGAGGSGAANTQSQSANAGGSGSQGIEIVYEYQ